MCDLVSTLLIMGTVLFILHNFRPRDKWGAKQTDTKEEE